MDRILNYEDKDDDVTEGYIYKDVRPFLNLGVDEATLVKLTGNQTIAGIKTFTSIPKIPTDVPTTDEEVAGKKYVDNTLSSTSAISSLYTFNTVYQNTNSKKILVVASAFMSTPDGNGLVAHAWHGISSDANDYVVTLDQSNSTVRYNVGVTFVVPPNYYFKVILRQDNGVLRESGWNKIRYESWEI